MIIATYPLIVAIIGALIFAFAKSELKEIGKILFFVGSLWLVYHFSGTQLRL